VEPRGLQHGQHQSVAVGRLGREVHPSHHALNHKVRKRRAFESGQAGHLTSL